MVVLASAASAPAADGSSKSGLHIPQTRQGNFTMYLTDSGGYRWDLQHGLQVGQGTNYLYGNGMYCQINGSNMQSPDGRGWMNAAGDEVEIGPWNRGSEISVHRRCKVYRNHAFARWLDIFTNPTSSAQTVSVRVYSSINGMIATAATSSGGGEFGEKDWAFVTAHGDGRPSLLHVLCGPKSRVRPGVSIQGNCIYINYTLSVPPGKSAVMCYFESQGQTAEELIKRMKAFRPREMLGDLSSEVRKLIVNFPVEEFDAGIELDRRPSADGVQLANGDWILGTINNPSYRLQTLHGPMDLPAEKVIGFAASADGTVRAAMLGGQVVSGTPAAGAVELVLPTGGKLAIPFAGVQQCAYRISKDKPEEAPMTDPLIVLYNGDRLAFDAAGLKLTLQTRHGPVPMESGHLLQIRLDGVQHGMHRAEFLNGSKLAGLLAGERISLPLKLGRSLDVPREMVRAIRFAAETPEAEPMTRMALSNGDVLVGRLADETLSLRTDFGEAPIRPDNLVAMAFDPRQPDWAMVRLWDGSTLRGQLRAEAIRFDVKPGPTVTVHLGQIVSVERPDALPPEHVIRLVNQYVAGLSAPNFKDRQEAEDNLMRMDATIAPLLKKYLEDTDPEVRQRVRNVLEKLGPSGPAGAGAGAPQPFGPWNGPMPWGGPQVFIRG
ncbi:MAG TPA: hypothetical protein VFJ30_09695 [Phycisphaerae bacterium]|nr:hypothetical protein [Phycisphaerae bacterium]